MIDPFTVFMALMSLIGVVVSIAVLSALFVLLWLSLREHVQARRRKKREEQMLVIWEQIDDIVGASPLEDAV